MLKDKTIGFGLCGSFCTLSQAVQQLELLSQTGCSILPVVSYSVAQTDTRFGTASHFISQIEAICGRKVIASIAEAEPIGPQKLCDIMVIMPCTGNTAAKLYNGITDTPVTMAAKSHLRNGRPLLIGIATNDGLSMNARNIGGLMNTRNVYFIPFGQDDAENKPTSLIANMQLLLPSINAVLNGKGLSPQLIV